MVAISLSFSALASKMSISSSRLWSRISLLLKAGRKEVEAVRKATKLIRTTQVVAPSIGDYTQPLNNAVEILGLG